MYFPFVFSVVYLGKKVSIEKKLFKRSAGVLQIQFCKLLQNTVNIKSNLKEILQFSLKDGKTWLFLIFLSSFFLVFFYLVLCFEIDKYCTPCVVRSGVGNVGFEP